MFRSSSPFDKLLEKATSNLLLEPDWPSIMQICDLIRQNDVQPKYALMAIKKKLYSPNPHCAMYALQVLESIVKNCGSAVHDELTTKANCEMLRELAKTTQHENVRQKVLELIQAWTFAFRKSTKYRALKDTMNIMKTEGFKFPTLRESDAMFSADCAPEWTDGDVCHRCRVQFSFVNRKHHCRACGNVFCHQCSQKTTTLPKFGIEKEVRVCDACYEQVTKPVTGTASTTSSVAPSVAAAAVATATTTTAAGGGGGGGGVGVVTTAIDKDKDTDLPAEYLSSSLAQQNQAPPRKSEDELREEEELQLALALSKSEAEHKEKEKMRVTSAFHSTPLDTRQSPPVVNNSIIMGRSPSPTEEQQQQQQQQQQQIVDPELARYLNRTYWESRQSEEMERERERAASPSAPSHGHAISVSKPHVNGLTVVDPEMDEFVQTLKSQVEIFVNRMKSNSSRGRSIANDSSVQTLFMNITAMHSRLLRYIQQQDDARLHYEGLQDKLTQVKDARAALDALRDEHREKVRRQAEEAERQRQLQMAHKLEIMRKKKQDYLQYQRQLALQRIQEQEREMQMRQEQQKQQYLMGPQFGYMGSPVHGAQPYAAAPPPAPPQMYQYPQYGHTPTVMTMPPPPPPPGLGGPQQMMQQPNPQQQPPPPPPSLALGQPQPQPQPQPPPLAMSAPAQFAPMSAPPAQQPPQPPAPPAEPQNSQSNTAELISFD